MTIVRRLLAFVFLLVSGSAFAHPPHTLDLRDLMDARYGAGAWTERTGVGVGTDIGPAIADGVATLRATMSSGRGKILIPPGRWLMNTWVELSGVYLEGMGSQASMIIYNNFNGAALSWPSLSGRSGGGARGIAILLESGLGNSNAYAIMLQGTSTQQPDQTEWDDIYISAVGGSSYWWDGFHVNGTARSSPKGIRVGTMNNVQIFNCRNVGIYMAAAVQWTLTNVGAYTGTGPYGNMLFVVGGSEHLYGIGVNTTFNISGASDVWINGTRY